MGRVLLGRADDVELAGLPGAELDGVTVRRERLRQRTRALEAGRDPIADPDGVADLLDPPELLEGDRESSGLLVLERLGEELAAGDELLLRLRRGDAVETRPGLPRGRA